MELFLLGMIVGTVITSVMICLFNMNEDENIKDNLTVEDCSKLKAKGFDVIIENGTVIDVTKSK